MSEQPNDQAATARDDAERVGATSQDFGNLSIEDHPDGTVDPAELAGSAGPGDDAVDA